MTHRYDDIIGLPHHPSFRRKQMTMQDRAAQFAPFAALTGYDDGVAEAGRLTADQLQLEENDLEKLDRKLGALMRKLEEEPGSNPEIRICWFQPDGKKEGGSYEKRTAFLKRVDTAERKLYFTDRTELSLDQIMELEPAEENIHGQEENNRG